MESNIVEILSLLNWDEYPQTCACLQAVASGQKNATPMELASMLITCDKPKPFPRYLVVFIMELYESEIEKGNADAMNDLGSCYYCGDRGFEQDFRKAVHYYSMAAENGSWQARENLGYCYYYGRDMDVDYEKAFHYFAPGAFNGHLISLYKIGDMYLNGYYVKQSERDAFLIYQRCLNLMDKDSSKFVGGPVHLRLGNMFLNGVGAERNPEQAMWHFHAAEYFLYNMVKDGDVMYKKSLHDAIEGQTMARAAMAEDLPRDEWTFDD
ncbi:MAG: tetratricopeptide repeat protein [bacterium]